MAEVKPSEVLIKAKELISQPGGWMRWFSMGYGKIPVGEWNVAPNVTSHAPGDKPAYPGAEPTQFCATGAMAHAARKLKANSYSRASEILNRAAPLTAKRLGRPMDGERAKYAFGRNHGQAAHYNNTSLEFSEVNELFCDAIKVAIEEEQNADD